MSKIFEGKIGLKLFAIALAVMMASSVLPAALAGQPTGCEHDHECAEHADEGCDCGHTHDACECGHLHGHDACHHQDGGPRTADHSDEDATLLSAPAQPATSGFPCGWTLTTTQRTAMSRSGLSRMRTARIV